MRKIITIFLFLLSICTNAQTLSNMYFLNENIGWIQTIDSTNTPLISYRTTNGGITWVQLDDQYKYRRIQFINDSVGFLLSGRKEGSEFVGERLFKSINKGETWQFLQDSLFQVEFANDNIGYAYNSYDYYLYKTIDGGITWERIETLGVISYTYKIKIINEYKIAIIDDNGKTLRLSTDSGETWKTIKFAPTDSDYIIFSVYFSDSMNGYLGTFQQDQTYTFYGTVIKTTDGGLTWKPLNVDNTINLYYLSMIDSVNGIAWDWWGESYYITHDGFTTWEKKFNNVLTRYYLYKGCREFFACGDSGYFAKSIDCGDTWNKIPFVVLNPTDINEDNRTVTNYILEQNYPNPFNPSTRIIYTLQSSGMTIIKIYDILGKEMLNLVNEYQTSGRHYVDFNANGINTGVYFYKINSGEYTQVKKMIFIK